MPRDGAGNYSLPSAYLANPPVTGTSVLAAQVTVPLADIASALTDPLLKNGTNAMSAALTLSGDPTLALHAAPKQYVDAVGNLVRAKAVVTVATTANLTLSGEQTIDGVLTSGSRVLVKNQSTASQNGIYVTSSGSWTRATDMDAWTEVPGAAVWVDQGSTQADTEWICTANAGGSIGSTSITFTQTAGAGSVSLSTLAAALQTFFCPTGSILSYAGASAPTDWLLCFGQAVSRTTYATLFALIGTTYGAGDGSTTFNLPDLRGRAIAGKDDMGGSAASRLATSISGTTGVGSAVITGLSSTTGLSVGMSVIGSTIPAGRTIASIDSATQVTLNSGTSVTAGTVTLRFAVVDGATLGASGGAQTHQLTTPQMPLHGHALRTSSVTGGINMSGNGSIPLFQNGTYDTTQAAYTGAPSNTLGQQLGGSGGDQAHPNVQPTLILNYIIRT